jgi:hypothetical protein
MLKNITKTNKYEEMSLFDFGLKYGVSVVGLN